MTGMPRTNVHFCATREDKKKPICDKLQISVFIDDHLDVLQFVRHSPSMRQLLLFLDDVEPLQQLPPGFVPVLNWLAVVNHLGIQLPLSIQGNHVTASPPLVSPVKETVSKTDKNKPCPQFAVGSCTRAPCAFSHVLCKNYEQNQSCKYADKCRFVHRQKVPHITQNL